MDSARQAFRIGALRAAFRRQLVASDRGGGERRVCIRKAFSPRAAQIPRIAGAARVPFRATEWWRKISGPANQAGRRKPADQKPPDDISKKTFKFPSGKSDFLL